MNIGSSYLTCVMLIYHMSMQNQAIIILDMYLFSVDNMKRKSKEKLLTKAPILAILSLLRLTQRNQHAELAEWSKAHDWKSCEG